ncbi:MAG TPA: CIA30 family protein, partial [Candidatus Obscuribacterales bacterium]
FGTAWLLFSDQVMDGASQARSVYEIVQGQPCVRLQGELEPGSLNGFIQLALPLVHSRYLFDARHFAGVRLRCRSPQADGGEGFSIQLRTRELSMPWQHYRAPFVPTAEWQHHLIPFADFVPVQTAHVLNLERLSRLAIVAGPPPQSVDLWLAEVGFY